MRFFAENDRIFPLNIQETFIFIFYNLILLLVFKNEEKYTDADDVKEREHHNIICHKLIKSSVEILETLIDIENGKRLTSKKENI